MSVDQRDAVWPHKDNLFKEDYSLSEPFYYPRTCADGRSGDGACKSETYMGCWTNNTPVMDCSPSSTELTSMLSDKSSSRGTFETKSSEHTCFSTDTGDTEHPMSEGSLSPQPCTADSQNANQYCSSQNVQSNNCPNERRTPTNVDAALNARPVANTGPNVCYTSGVVKPHDFGFIASPCVTSSLSEYGYSTNRTFSARASYSVNSSSLSGPARPFYSQTHPQYSPYTRPSMFPDTRNVNGLPFADEYTPYPGRQSNEFSFPTTPHRYPSACQPARSPRPNSFSWFPHQRNYYPSSSNESLDMKRRFDMQQSTYPPPTTSRFPNISSQEYYQQVPDRVRRSPYPHPDPCAHLRTQGYTDPTRCYTEYRNPHRTRFPKLPYPLSSNQSASGLYGHPHPWPLDVQNTGLRATPYTPLIESHKKRAPPNPSRGAKRRRTSNVNEEKADPPRSSMVDVHASLALSCLLSLNVSSCLSTPALENPVDVNPPEPALQKSTCHESRSSSYLRKRNDYALEIPSNYAQKYSSLAFNLRLRIQETQDGILSVLNKGERTPVDFQRNHLKKAFTAAISRLAIDVKHEWYTAPPSPPITSNESQDPLHLFLQKRKGVVDSDQILFRPKRRRISDRGSADVGRPASHPAHEVSAQRIVREVYAEKRINLEAFVLTSTWNVCRNCGMQIFPSDGNVPCLVRSPADMFCSVSCRSKHAAVLKQRVGRPPANSLPNLLYSDPVISQVPVLIKGPPSKLSKQPPKNSSIGKINRRYQREFSTTVPTKRWLGSRWAVFSHDKHLTCVSRVDDCLPHSMSNWLRPLLGGNQVTSLRDTRTCDLCKQTSDADESLAGRLLNYTCDKWIHVNCVLWCYEAYETLDGCLMNVEQALEKARRQRCTDCHWHGAGLPCFAVGCPLVYHVQCAYNAGCSFHKDRSMFCPAHQNQAPPGERLETLKVSRRVYLSRDEYDLVAGVIGTQCSSETKKPRSFRVGTLILNSIGQLLPEHLEGGRFHNPSFIYPVGFSTTRIFWSYQRPGQRCRYTCTIVDSSAERLGDHGDNVSRASPSPIFKIIVSDPGFATQYFKAATCSEVWQQILTAVQDARKRSRITSLTLFPNELIAEDLFGLSEPHIVRAIESLPGVEYLRGYVFKFGKMQLITKMPLMVNPTGCARSEPKLRTYVRNRNRDSDHGASTHQKPSASISSPPHLGFLRPLHQILRICSPNPSTAPTGKQSTPIMSKYQQYRCLKFEWKNNVILARSKIQGLGLFAANDIEKQEFIIEYLGQVIRNEVGNQRERLYDAQNRGIYMFRADDDCIVDATMYGGLARYINHSCEPNCIAEVFAFEASKRIIIIAKRFIKKGEELTYDYKFDLEEDKPSRIPCLCGAQFCRKWMN